MIQTKVPVHISGPISAVTDREDVPLEERVAQLEARLISQAAQSGPAVTSRHFNDRPATPDTIDALEALSSNTIESTHEPEKSFSSHQTATDLRTDEPVGSIFNNAIWAEKLSKAVPAGHQSRGLDKPVTTGCHRRDSKVCDELCKDLPPPRLVAAIVSATSSWWSEWRAVGSWLKNTLMQNNLHSLQEAISWTLASDDPPVAALGTLLLATCFQQLDSRAHESIIQQLPRSPGEIFHNYFDRIHRLILNDTTYLSSEAGVELLMTIAKTYMNLGLLKNGWIMQHRAIAHAQLLGFHRPHHKGRETESQMISRNDTWFTICEQDLYTSLLLGLPYAAKWQTIESRIRGEEGTLEFFRYQMIRLSARILDRNQMGLETSICQAQNIESDMASAAANMSPEFWNAAIAFQTGAIDAEAYTGYLAGQFWFFQAKVLLHQPLMTQSIEDHQLLYYRDACLAACRETLRLYHLMRSDSISAFDMTKLIDFQAFVCSAILLLGILGYGSSKSPPSPLMVENENDLEFVELTLRILRQASATSNNTMASQAVQGLNALTMLVRYSTGRDKSGLCTVPKEDSIPYINITVPGSGVITIIPGKLIASNSCTTQEPATVLMPPTFHLNDSASYISTAQIFPAENLEQDPTSATALDIDISMMDMDWFNTFGKGQDNDWAWLAEINANGMV
ncbi:hypothetical protein VTL71DRAFT_16556 [Oculimacula yallundae]|uniref:Transcription factor domain-containing protein n=1 Tax=Oculimacula yallundae TaxID=86028 RepID=A0ABR4CEW7_9HELO